jgi:archaellum component FlaG (FlaF/FlaG flagellin family)
MFKDRLFEIVLLLFLSFPGILIAQEKAELYIGESTHDFGAIAEADGLASHTFIIKNTGADPLVITRVTASCGCTRPDWTKSPIEPGSSGEVTISYNPKGRPGPFLKSVSVVSNAKNKRTLLYVKGNVTPEPALASQPAMVYPYNIGPLKLQTKTIQYSSIRPGETGEEKIPVRNESEHPLTVHIGKLPDYLTAEALPATLQPGETGEIQLSFNTDKAKRMGRIHIALPVEVESGENKKNTNGKIDVAANVIDNFTKLSAADKAKAPAIQFSSTLLDFGKLPEKSGGILPFIGVSGKESEVFTITNTGKSLLSVYSVACDDDFVAISGGRKELKPGATAEYKVSIRPKEIKTKIESFIHVVCNDPNGPVRLIKVTAEK